MARHGPVQKIQTLERRLAWLQSRIAKGDSDSNSYMMAEASALEWALPILKSQYGKEEE